MHQNICRIFHTIKDIWTAKITLEDCNDFSEVKTSGLTGNESNVSTMHRKPRTIQEILETSDKISELSKKPVSEEKAFINCPNCNAITDDTYTCSECGKQCCDACSYEVGSYREEKSNKKERICDDCWSK